MNKMAAERQEITISVKSLERVRYFINRNDPEQNKRIDATLEGLRKLLTTDQLFVMNTSGPSTIYANHPGSPASTYYGLKEIEWFVRHLSP